MLRPLLVGDAVALVFDEPVDVPPLDTDEEGFADPAQFHFQRDQVRRTRRGAGIGDRDPVADTVSFHVHDTGIGIEPADVVIFQEFGQVARRLQGRVKGTQLGLPLSQKLAELLSSRITVDDEPQFGVERSIRDDPRFMLSRRLLKMAQNWVLDADKVPIVVVKNVPTMPTQSSVSW